VCGRVLDRFEGDDGSIEYIHTLQDRERGEDHPAVPATEAEIQTIGRCDFCNTDYPRWGIPARTFELPGTPGHFSDGDWAACDTCKALIVKKHWDTLVRRATERSNYRTIMTKEVVRGMLATMYGHLRKNINGEPYLLEKR
jgi:hypothetical protein